MILMREVTAARSGSGSVSTVVQHAVDAVAHAQAVLARLDVDVGGLRFDGARDHVVHQADDRRLARQVLQAADVVLAGALGRGGRGLAADGGAAAVQPFECALDLAGAP